MAWTLKRVVVALGYLVGGLCFRLRQYRLAAAIYGFVLYAHPGELSALRYRASALTELARADEFASPDTTLSAIEAYDSYVSRQPDSPQEWYVLATLKHRRGDYRGAVDAAKEAIRFTREPSADYHYQLGTSLLALEDWQSAIDALRLAVHYDPSASDANSQLGLALARVGQQKESLTWLQRAFELSPADEHRLNLAGALADQGQTSAAADLLYEGITIGSGGPEVRLRLAEVRASEGKLDEALELARQAQRLCVSERSALLLAGVLVEAKQPEQAKAVLMDALLSFPASTRLLGALAAVWFALSDGQRAQEAFERALKAADGANEAAEWRAWLHAGRAASLSLQGRHAEARAIFEVAMALDDNLWSHSSEFLAELQRSSRED